MFNHRTTSAFAVLLAVGLAACDDGVMPPVTDTGTDHGAHEHVSSRPGGAALAGHEELLKEVRRQTSRFNSTVQAIRAGYEPSDHCVSDPVQGGMGYHWINGALIDPVFDPLQPEALLYAPGRGNNPRLVGVEYIVIDAGQPHPHFGNRPFDVGGVPPLTAAGVAHYSLHVWVHEENPVDTFAPYNPRVSCS
jgi:hypothetical protein